MMKNLGNDTIIIHLSTASISCKFETKKHAITKYLKTTGFGIIDSSDSVIVAKIPDGWTMKFAYGDDTTLVRLCDKDGRIRIENYNRGDGQSFLHTRFKCRYEVYTESDSSNRNITYMVDNASGKKKAFSILPYFDSKQIKLAERAMLNRFPRMNNPLAYWK